TNDAQINTGFQTNTPLVNSLDDNRTPLPNVYSNPYPAGINQPAGSALGALTFAGQNSTWFNPDLNIPLVHQFSMGFQYQTSQGRTMAVSYVGSRSRGLNDARDCNFPALGFRKQCNLLGCGSAAYCDAHVPNPFKGIEAFRGTSYLTPNNI